MNKYTLACFGEIDLDNLEDYYDAEITLDDRQIEVDITFDEKTIDIEKMKKINEWLSDPNKLDKIGLASVKEDFESGETVSEYIEHHLEELDGDDVKTLLQQAKGGATKEEKLLQAIQLVRIGFYPHSDERFVNLDYSLDSEMTNYLVVLDYTEDGKLHYITMES